MHGETLKNAYTNFYLNVNFPFRKYKLFYPFPKGISNHTLSSSKVKGAIIMDKPYDQTELMIWRLPICRNQNIWSSKLTNAGSSLPYPKHLVLHVTNA